MKTTTFVLTAMLLLTVGVTFVPSAAAAYCGTGGLWGGPFEIARRTTSNCIDHAEAVYYEVEDIVICATSGC